MHDFIQKNFKGDPIIWIILLLLMIISAVEMYSASSTLAFKHTDFILPVWRHIMFLGAGFCIVFVVHLLPYRMFPLFGGLLLPFCFILLIVTLVGGVSANNAARWLELGGFQFQPSEFAKLAVIIILAFLLGRKQQEGKPSDEVFPVCITILTATCLLIFLENLSTSVLIFLVGLLVMFFGRVSFKRLVQTLAIAITAGMLFFFMIPYFAKSTIDENGVKKEVIQKPFHRFSTWHDRVERYFSGKKSMKNLTEFVANPDNYQEIHAKIAVANSKGIGRGPGNSIERDFLPQAYSDFIFAVIIEELGLWGGLIVMLLYLILLFRSGVIANKCQNAFPALLVLGLACMIVTQAILNMAVAVGLFPITGQTLPMISRGGTSIITTSICFGIILCVSRHVEGEGKEEGQKEEEEDEDDEDEDEDEEEEYGEELLIQ